MASVRLTRKLVLEEAQTSPDGAGGFDTVWTGLGTLWAEVSPRTGRDRAGEAVSLSHTTYRIVVRAAPEGAPSRPRPGQRFRDGSRLFHIVAVTERDAEARYLTCFAEEEVAI